MCKPWARALRGTSHAWRVVSIGGRSWDDEETDRPVQLTKEEHARAGLTWFMSRPG